MRLASFHVELAPALAVILAFGAVGCVADGTAAGPPYDVMVLDRVDGATDGGQWTFALQRRTLQTVTTFSRLETPAFRAQQGGTLSLTENVDGDQASSGSFEGGRDPDLRYAVEDGTAVPRDDATLLMFSAAYQFERVLPGLVAASAPDVGTAFTDRGPMDIFFGSQVKVSASGVATTARGRTNAFFLPSGWQFGVERTSALEHVPLGADRRVIAHELGHAVFQIVFFGGHEPDCDPAQAEAQAADPWFRGRLSSELAISGLNEGFADWMSFAVTGGTNPVESLNLPTFHDLDLNQVRVLTDDNFRWAEVYKMEGAPGDLRCLDMYCVGTMFARSLVATYLAQGHAIADEDARHEFSRTVVGALRGTAERMRSVGLPPATPDVARCQRRDSVSAQLDPPVIGAFLEAFLGGLAPAQAAQLCNQLAQRFQDGFPAAFRMGCTP